jgi:hypothetical protein
MQRMGSLIPDIKELQKAENDPNFSQMDDENLLSQQQKKSLAGQKHKTEAPANTPTVARKKLHWTSINQSKLTPVSFWNKSKGECASLAGLDTDNEEFVSLFMSPVNKSAAPKKGTAPGVKKPSGSQKLLVVESQRRLNAAILLKNLEVDMKSLAKQVDSMENVGVVGDKLRGLMKLLPTETESGKLRQYLPPSGAPQTLIDESIDKFGECEKYMAVMLYVLDAKEKFQCMLFRAEFEQQVDNIRDGSKLLINACISLQNSERFKKLLMYVLKFGNALNSRGSGGEEVTAITLDSLLKLAEVSLIPVLNSC